MRRRIMELNGSDWRLGQAPPGAIPDRATWNELEQIGDWLPATVPGNVRGDLIQAGRLPNLSYGAQPEATQWVDNHCWWVKHEFSLSPTPADRAHLILRGVDYVSDLFFNGQHLGRHEGMFSPQVHDVTNLLGTENWLAVRILGSRWLPCDRSAPWEKLLNRIEARLGQLAGSFPHRRDTLKCQMGFGWDFAPPLRTMGIWDDVYLVLSKNVFIQQVAIRQRVAENRATMIAQVEVDARQGCSAQLRAILAGETFEAEPFVVERLVELSPGSSHHQFELAVPQPSLWWPWDYGRPDLYRMTIEVRNGAELLDSTSHTLGLRQVELKGWTMHVNGYPIFARGANWVPADLLPGCVTDADYHALLTLARQANMNLLRVWGGGLREKRTFYDLCDRLGILVWQEFPFACAFLTRYPRSREYLRLVEAEARAIVRDLRNHACVTLWCGGNELNPQRNAPLVATLRRVAESEDPSRPFVSASPSHGDSHNWHVWHHFHPPSAYRDDEALFASEFGLQAPPGKTALGRFIPPEDLWPAGPSWIYHGAGLEKLQRYAQPFLVDQEATLETFIEASQRAQGYGLQIAIEHYRRRKARGCGGVLVWQLNEPWPAISWALFDFFRQPKTAYNIVKRLYNPLLVSMEYPLKRFQSGEHFCANVWVINDRPEALPGCRVEAILRDGIGKMVDRFVRTVDVPADTADIIGCFCCTLPTGGGWRLACQITDGEQVLTTNEYDLAVYDGIQPTLKQRLWSWLSGLVAPA